jgi:hypothetical protein
MLTSDATTSVRFVAIPHTPTNLPFNLNARYSRWPPNVHNKNLAYLYELFCLFVYFLPVTVTAILYNDSSQSCE